MGVKKEDVDRSEHCFRLFCEMMKSEILELSDNQKLPRTFYLRIRGMHTGKFIANNNIKSKAYYPYEVMLKTLILSKSDIMLGFRRNQIGISQSRNRFNYAMAVVENKINDVYTQEHTNKQNKEFQKHSANEIDISFRERGKRKKEVSRLADELWK